MIDLLKKYTKEELYSLFDSFTKKGDIHEYFGITDNSSGIKYIKDIAEAIGFDLSLYSIRKKRYCLLCGKELKHGQYKFCCSSHAATYNNKKRHKKENNKQEKRNNIKPNNGNIPRRKERKQHTSVCPQCGKEFKYQKGKKCCSVDCCLKYKSNETYKYFLEHPEEFCRGNYVPRYNIREHILEEQNNACAICGGETTHNGKPLVFVLDHIDGDASNNRRENLRLICPNCDSQLDTYKSKNKNSTRRNYWKEHIINQIYSCS